MVQCSLGTNSGGPNETQNRNQQAIGLGIERVWVRWGEGGGEDERGRHGQYHKQAMVIS